MPCRPCDSAPLVHTPPRSTAMLQPANPTVSPSLCLSVDQAGAIRFEPELPAWKQEAVRRLGFGDLNKVGRTVRSARAGRQQPNSEEAARCVAWSLATATTVRLRSGTTVFHSLACTLIDTCVTAPVSHAGGAGVPLCVLG